MWLCSSISPGNSVPWVRVTATASKPAGGAVEAGSTSAMEPPRPYTTPSSSTVAPASIVTTRPRNAAVGEDAGSIEPVLIRTPGSTAPSYQTS